MADQSPADIVRHASTWSIVWGVSLILFGMLAVGSPFVVAVAVCVVPDEVWLNCRPESRVANPTDAGISREEKKSRRHGQGSLFEEIALEQYHLSPNFRRQLKARSMKWKIPLQIVRESTLRLSDEHTTGERRLTPPRARM